LIFSQLHNDVFVRTHTHTHTDLTHGLVGSSIVKLLTDILDNYKVTDRVGTKLQILGLKISDMVTNRILSLGCYCNMALVCDW